MKQKEKGQKSLLFLLDTREKTWYHGAGMAKSFPGGLI